MSDKDIPRPMVDPTSPPPIIHGEPVELASGVFVIPDGRVPLVSNVGIIVGDRAVLVIDCGLGPRNGSLVRSAAERLAGGRPLFLTLSHFHPEHGFGAQAFRGATILYNRLQQEEFRQKAKGYLHQFRSFGPAIAEQLEGVEFVDPHVVYDQNADLDLGGKLVQMRSWGPAHSRGDQIVFLPEQRILFTGDLVENRFYPIFPYLPPHDTDVDPDRWLIIMGALQQLDPEIVVPGHGEVGDVNLIDTTTQFMMLLRSKTKQLALNGADASDIIAKLVPEFTSRYPNWESEPWRIATGVQTFLAK